MIRNERANATIQTLFLTLQLSSLRLLLSFSTRKPQYVHGLSCYSFKLPYRTVPSKPPTIPYGIVACTFSDLSRNSCIQNELSTRGTGSLTYDTPGNAWVYERRTETHILLRTKMCDFPRSYFRARNILGHPGADSGGEGKSKRAEKCATKKSKERREEPLGTMSYQTRSKRSPPFCLVIGQKNTKVFWHLSEVRTAATVWNWSGKTLYQGALLVALYFSSCNIFPTV